MCETALPPAAVKCPRCGMLIRTAPSDTTEVHARDVVLAVIMAVIAIVGTVPMTYPMLKAIATSQATSTIGVEIVLVGIWNGIILGIPVVQLARRWYLRVRKGDFDHGWVWRDYWRLQVMALSPIWFCVAYIVVTRDYYWFVALMNR